MATSTVDFETVRFIAASLPDVKVGSVMDTEAVETGPSWPET